MIVGSILLNKIADSMRVFECGS